LTQCPQIVALLSDMGGSSQDCVGMAKAKGRELIACHDCGEGVSFSAASCPHCGSTEPVGPYLHSRRELRKLRGEAANDHRLVIVTLACCCLGVVYGAVMGPGGAASFWQGLGYGFVGAVIGVPAAFIINVTRHWLD
jgi:hypothetical protein